MTTVTASIITLDPRDDSPAAPSRLAQRAATLDGKVIGLFSNNKPHSEDLLRRIAAIIGERYDIAGTVSTTRAAGSGRRALRICGRRRAGLTWRYTLRRNEGPARRAVCTTQWKPSCWASRPPF